jgi:hypothetical protein
VTYIDDPSGESLWKVWKVTLIRLSLLGVWPTRKERLELEGVPGHREKVDPIGVLGLFILEPLSWGEKRSFGSIVKDR